MQQESSPDLTPRSTSTRGHIHLLLTASSSAVSDARLGCARSCTLALNVAGRIAAAVAQEGSEPLRKRGQISALLPSAG